MPKGAADILSAESRTGVSRLRRVRKNEVNIFGPAGALSLPTIRRRLLNPTGLHRLAQGCEARATLGQADREKSTPTGLQPEHIVSSNEIQSRWGWRISSRHPG